jgi:RNA polymerase primary sigma factor
MENQQEFLEELQDLVRIGKTNGDVLTKEEIRSYFSGISLDDTKMELIAAYMAENQIRIKGVIPAAFEAEEEEVTSEEEPSAVLNMYMEEMKEIAGMHDEEEAELVRALESGDLTVVNTLLEINLEAVAALAEKFRGKGMQMNDLIQEGNLALFCAITQYDRAEHGEFHPYIMNSAKDAMLASLEENMISARTSRKMAQQINRMNELATAMAKEFGREAKPEELAEQMKISVEEVKDLMKISLDAVNVYEQK